MDPFSWIIRILMTGFFVLSVSLIALQFDDIIEDFKQSTSHIDWPLLGLSFLIVIGFLVLSVILWVALEVLKEKYDFIEIRRKCKSYTKTQMNNFKEYVSETLYDCSCLINWKYINQTKDVYVELEKSIDNPSKAYEFCDCVRTIHKTYKIDYCFQAYFTCLRIVL